MRTLGPAEEIFFRLDDSSPMIMLLTAVVSGGLTTADLRAAVDAVQRRHPLLEVRITAERARKPRFERTDQPIPIVELEPGQDVDVWVRQELLVPFDSSVGPLLLVAIQPLPDDRVLLLLKMHHAIGDGRSLVLVLRDLLQAAAQRASGSTAALESLEVLPYFAQRFPARTRGPRGLVRYVRLIAHVIAEVVRNGRPKFLEVQQSVSVARRELSVLTARFGTDVLNSLADRARAEGTTVHGALYAAIVLAAAGDIADGEPASIGCASSVDMRSRLEPPAGEDVGYLVSVVGSVHRVSSRDSLWQVARDIKAAAEKALDRDMHFVLMPLPYRVHAWVTRRFLRRKPTRTASYLEAAHNPPCIVLTNMGHLPVERSYGRFTVEDVSAFANPSVLTPFGSIVSTLHGTMTWTLIGSVPVVSNEQLARVFTDAQRYLFSALDVESAAS